jgi:hypothetical protein
MSIEPPSHEGTHPDGGNDPTNESRNNRTIADSIDAFRKDYSSGQKKNDRQYEKQLFWNRVTAGAVGIYAVLTFALVILGKCSLETTIESSASIQRAWIQAQFPTTVNNGMDGNSPKFSIQYSNVGREPAFGFVGRARIDTIPLPSGTVAGWLDLPVWSEVTELKQDNICDGVSAKTGREVLYPDYSVGTLYTNQNSSIQIDTVKNKIAILIVYGCLAYKTQVMQGDRHSSFCWFFDPGTFPQGPPVQPPRCPVGNYAD